MDPFASSPPRWRLPAWRGRARPSQVRTFSRTSTHCGRGCSILQRWVDQERRIGARPVARVQLEVDTLLDELIYLRVKQRKEGSLDNGEMGTLRTNIADLEERLYGGRAPCPDGSSRESSVSDEQAGTIRLGTEIDVRRCERYDPWHTRG